MELHIAGKNVPIKTGVRFLEELDKRYKADYDGQEIDFGLQQLFVNFSLNSVPSLKLAIYAGTRTNDHFKPSDRQIEDFLDEQEDYEWLFDAFRNELSEANATKKLWRQLNENM